jgi:hypothetical protein
MRSSLPVCVTGLSGSTPAYLRRLLVTRRTHDSVNFQGDKPKAQRGRLIDTSRKVKTLNMVVLDKLPHFTLKAGWVTLNPLLF